MRTWFAGSWSSSRASTPNCWPKSRRRCARTTRPRVTRRRSATRTTTTCWTRRGRRWRSSATRTRPSSTRSQPSSTKLRSTGPRRSGTLASPSACRTSRIVAVPARIEEYGLIGDLQAAALVSRDGSIDWACFPRFDSDACFAALLGEEKHGCWWIRPVGGRPKHRRYWHDTLVLETEFESDAGRIRLIDFMPPRETKPDIVRIVEGLDGKVDVRTEIRVRFGYGESVPWAHRVSRDLVFTAGPDALCLRTPVRLRGEDFHTVGEFTVSEGERIPFVLTWFPSHEEPPTPVDPEQALHDTESFWREWADRCEHPSEGPYHDEIHRSLLVLKALTYAPTGGIVAAPTTSLPEQPGGVRNWDYRYTWLRDASITLLAMLEAGYVDEATAWRDWLLRAVAGNPEDIQIMYGIAGERR